MRVSFLRFCKRSDGEGDGHSPALTGIALVMLCPTTLVTMCGATYVMLCGTIM